MAAGTSDDTIRPGIQVELHSLKGAAEFNGKSGTVKEWDDDKGRWIVEVAGERKAFKPDNLKPKTTKANASSNGSSNMLVIAALIGMIAFIVMQNGMFDNGIDGPVKWAKSLVEPFDPPPPKAPQDTVVISFCQG